MGHWRGPRCRGGALLSALLSQPSTLDKVLCFDFTPAKINLGGWEMALWVKGLAVMVMILGTYPYGPLKIGNVILRNKINLGHLLSLPVLQRGAFSLGSLSAEIVVGMGRAVGRGLRTSVTEVV